MLIAEAPGIRELEAGIPLVGPAGKLSDQLLEQAGLQRSLLRLANRCGCVDLDREDRKPLPAEMDACWPRLLEDIAITRPQVIIAMGGVAIASFFPGLSISRARGKLRAWIMPSPREGGAGGSIPPHEDLLANPLVLNSTPVIATYHPAYGLAHRSPEVRPLIVEDLLKARSMII